MATEQSHNKHSIALAPKQTCRPMESNRRSRNKPMQLCLSDSWQSCQKHTVETDSLLNKWCWEIWIYTQWRRLNLDPNFSPCTKHQFRIYQRPQYKAWNFETVRGKHRQSLKTEAYIMLTLIGLHLLRIQEQELTNGIASN
jgi:hypothetical protein